MAEHILFSGHMIDKKGRSSPRFPASKAVAAGVANRGALEKILKGLSPSKFSGIAGAACGGDILFHEACRDLGIPSEVYLGMPVDEFNKTSVSFAGKDWEERYYRLVNTLPVHILFPEATADAKPEIWEKANEWMLKAALAGGGAHMTLIALWDGNRGETGGARQMIDAAKAQDARIEILDIKTI